MMNLMCFETEKIRFFGVEILRENETIIRLDCLCKQPLDALCRMFYSNNLKPQHKKFDNILDTNCSMRNTTVGNVSEKSYTKVQFRL